MLARNCREMSSRLLNKQSNGVNASCSFLMSTLRRPRMYGSVVSTCRTNEKVERLLGKTTNYQLHRNTSSAAYDQTMHHVNLFPSLIIGSKEEGIQSFGSFAEAQATYLDPDQDAVDQIVDLLRTTNMGIVAHYYMDVELQGVLHAASKILPGRIGIADSLKMGDMAVDMCKLFNCSAIMCLGVDFMSESVAAILGSNGFTNTPVYRATQAKIGCSLAESAESDVYQAWLRKESAGRSALHVIYINTSLETKAVSSSIVPTITCTSSNVLQTLLTASSQMKFNDLKILYGPDTYMGQNLITLLTTIVDVRSGWDDKKIAATLHPDHNRSTLTKLRDSISVFPSGNCVVHHMFGKSVVETVKQSYANCYVTAHLEVPGEMFEIAMQKALNDEGVVGSTSDILNFIARKVKEATKLPSSPLKKSERLRLKFILGTEAGMVTSIVQSVQDILSDNSSGNAEAEIIFPVASDAVTATEGDGLVPGVAGGEGCSTAGGCATCPFMKMNSLDNLVDVLQLVESASAGGSINLKLSKHLPPNKLGGKLIDGRDAFDLGTESIAYMRHFNKHRKLPEELVHKVIKA